MEIADISQKKRELLSLSLSLLLALFCETAAVHVVPQSFNLQVVSYVGVKLPATHYYNSGTTSLQSWGYI